MKEFKPRITNINHIGDELRFQRYYYCYKNNKDIRLKSESLENSSKFEKLEDVLLEYIDENFGNISEKGASYDNLYSIENNKSRKKNVTYNPNTYYLRIYSLFKIYGFLDDYEIFRLLEQYNIKPNFKDSKLIASGLIGNCEEEYQFNNRKKYFDINSCRIGISKSDIDKILSYKNITFFSNKNYLEKCSKEDKSSYSVFFSKFKKVFKDKLSSLDETEKKIISLEMGKPSNFVDNYLNGKKYSILTCHTILKFLELYNLQESDLYLALLNTSPAFIWSIYKDMIPHTHFKKLNKKF